MADQGYNFTMGVDSTADPNPRAWGGQGRRLDANGNPIPGTSGAEIDAKRYQAMGAQGQAAPIVDPARSNETRAMALGSLGILGDTAAGGTTRVDALGHDLASATQNAGYSQAASVRGGAMARAAASRAATMQGAVGMARANQQIAAQHAAGMANARGAYAGATTGLRGQDLGLATTNAALEMGQRGQNEGRSQFYEGLGFDTANAENEAQMGVSAQDSAARASAQNIGLQRDAASSAGVKSAVGTGSAVLQGGVAAYDKMPGAPPPKSTDPWDPSNYSGSDERMKTGAKPMRKGITSHLSDKVRSVVEGLERGRDAILPQPARESQPIGTDALHAGIEQSIADAPESPRYGVTRADGDISGHNLHLSKADPGYAASRAGQAGYMFGGAPPVAHGYERPGAMPMAPGTDDFARYGAPVDRNVMTSDAHAKQEAYALGRAHGATSTRAHPIDWAYEIPTDIAEPSVMSGDRGGAQKTTGKAGAEYGRTVPPARDEEGYAERARYAALTRPDVPAPPAAHAHVGGVQRVVNAARGVTESVLQAPIEAAQQGYAALVEPSTPPSAMRAQTTSDERTKYGAHDESAMAGANRSMAPFEYAYKPGFAEEAGQREGEKNVGPMAQHMASDPVARTAIVERPDGMLAIDKDKGLKLVMGSVASLQQQMDKLQPRRRAK